MLSREQLTRIAADGARVEAETDVVPSASRPPRRLLPAHLRRALVHDDVSQPNKLHLITGWRDRGYFVESRWKGEPLRSRLQVQLESGAPWETVRSFEFDVRPALKWARE